MRKFQMLLALLLTLTMITATGCTGTNGVKLDPDNPVVITVWHYYNGGVLNAFEAAIAEFNETIGETNGVIVEAYGFGNVTDLEQAILSSANKEIGSMDMPNIFASYADTAYSTEKLGLLADLSAYFTEEEQAEYHTSYIEEGKIGPEGELRIFPVAKSTEVLMVNETDWQPFADELGYTYDDIADMEGMADVSRAYYDWSGGKAFFGRDSMANFFIIASKQFGTEIFQVANGQVTVNVNPEVMRKIWDYYYVPYISGYYASYGRFRSDDVKVGDLLAYVGSTSSAAYFPTDVTINSSAHPVAAKVLSAPLFKDGERVMVQQGAGMAVTKNTPETEYASLMFLKWFTGNDININFSVLSGYMPVKDSAIDYDLIKTSAIDSGIAFNTVTDETLRVAIEDINRSELYTNKAFTGGVEARGILEYALQDKCVADREAVLAAISGGASHQDAVAEFNTDENFEAWAADFTSRLNSAIGQ